MFSPSDRLWWGLESRSQSPQGAMLGSGGWYEIYDGDCQHMNRSLNVERIESLQFSWTWDSNRVTVKQSLSYKSAGEVFFLSSSSFLKISEFFLLWPLQAIHGGTLDLLRPLHTHSHSHFSALHRRNVDSWIQRRPKMGSELLILQTSFKGQVWNKQESWNPGFLHKQDLFLGQRKPSTLMWEVSMACRSI